MEHILASKIMKHGEENNILYPLQHGFRKGHSCETQLIEFVDDISKNLQEGQQTDILILDFAKAFDKVNHSLLIHKLQHYGIIGKSVRWIQNWLANRKPGTRLCHRQRVLLLMLVLIGGRLCSRGRALDLGRSFGELLSPH
jgi:retron-type reverse transcriptase